MDAEVAVVGAGPTGLMLANELALAGVRPVIIDKLIERSGQSKALGLQPRSIEIFDQRGLWNAVESRSLGHINGGHFAGLPVPLDYSSWDTRHPYQLGIPQARTEAVLEEQLSQVHEITVARGVDLLDLTQDADSVTATVQDHQGRRQLRTEHLVGCDGGRSLVRKLLGVPFPGHPATTTAFVADVTLAGETDSLSDRLRSMQSFLTREGVRRWPPLIPLGDGVYRLIGTSRDVAMSERDRLVTVEEVRAALRENHGDALELGDVLWASRFTDASRQVERYRVGRVLLAGDAAHIHLPAGGQGLNLGVQDAMNLGWKLAGVVHGWASESVLDSYHDERHPVGARVLENTRAQNMMINPSLENEALRDLFAHLMRMAPVNHYLAGMVSGLDIRYPTLTGNHPLVGSRMPDVAVQTTFGADRVSELLHSGRAVFLELNPAAAVDWRNLLTGWTGRVDQVVAQSQAEQVAGLTAVLIRPDGHVCWATDHDDVDGLKAVLNYWLGAPAGTGVRAGDRVPANS